MLYTSLDGFFSPTVFYNDMTFSEMIFGEVGIIAYIIGGLYYAVTGIEKKQ